jgi:Tol biopolymer transport system component
VVTPTPSVTPTPRPPTPSPTPIAFYAVRNGQADIFTVPPSGGKIDNLTQDAPADSDPKWSPDGTRLAFDSRRVDGHRNVWVLEPDGITFTRLTEDTTSSNSLPSWSPDGAGITWVHDGEIWVMNLADRSRIQLTTGADDSRPSWSPSGLIVFGRTTPNGSGGFNHTIFTVPADQSEAASVLIDVPEGGGRQPSWSPDGKRIAYVRLQNGVLRIWIAAANGGSRKVITPGSPCPCQYPTWSPDGKSIGFQAGEAKKEQIYVVPVAGGSPRRVTDGAGQNLAPGWGT